MSDSEIITEELVAGELVVQEPAELSRTISVERTYVLGQYKNIKLFDSITNIPKDVALNPESLALLRQLQMITLDSTYLRYLRDSVTLKKEFTGSPKQIEEWIELLDEAKVETLAGLKEAFASVETKTEIENGE